MTTKAKTEKQQTAFYNKVFKMFKEVYSFHTTWFDGTYYSFEIKSAGIYVTSTQDNGSVFYGTNDMVSLAAIGNLSIIFKIKDNKIVCRIF